MGGLLLKAHLIELNDAQQHIVSNVAEKLGATEAEVIEQMLRVFLYQCQHSMEDEEA